MPSCRCVSTKQFKIFMQSVKKSVIIIIGPPGSGKGTQAELLANKLGCYYFETARILENIVMNAAAEKFKIVEGKKYFFGEQKKKWETGKLMDSSIVTVWVNEKIQELANDNQNLVIAGSPRTLYEAEKVMPVLEKLYKKNNIKTIFFTLPEKESLFRNSHRRICELMRHPVLFNKDTQNLKTCPLDGSKIIERKKLDDPETIKKRLRVYAEETIPVINYLKKHKFSVKNVSAKPAPSVIFANILKALNVK